MDVLWYAQTDPGNGKEPSKIHHFTITNEEIDQILHAIRSSFKGEECSSRIHFIGIA